MASESALLAIREKLHDSLAILDEYRIKSPILKAKHDVILKGSKSYRDIISKLAHLASWGDLTGGIVGLVNAVASKSHMEFPNRLKFVSSNVVLAGATKGPIQGKLLSTRLHDNTWYYVLKKTVEIAIRANQHTINEIERVKATAAIAAKKEAPIKVVSEEEEEAAFEKKVIDMTDLQLDIPDSWDD